MSEQHETEKMLTVDGLEWSGWLEAPGLTYTIRQAEPPPYMYRFTSPDHAEILTLDGDGHLAYTPGEFQSPDPLAVALHAALADAARFRWLVATYIRNPFFLVDLHLGQHRASDINAARAAIDAALKGAEQ